MSRRLPSASPPRGDARPWVERLHWVMRVGVVGEFIGHGWVGLHRPAAWLPLFGVFGFGSGFAHSMMPVIGAWDITVGIVLLFTPVRALLLWTALWGLFTALLRPLAGLGLWELLERAHSATNASVSRRPTRETLA